MRRSRNSNKPVKPKPVIIDEPTPRDIEIFKILWWHGRTPSHFIRWHFEKARTSGDFITHLGDLREEQNAYIKWCDWPLNVKSATNNRHGIYELAPRGAKALGLSMPKMNGQDIPHDFVTTLHELCHKFQARERGLPIHFLDSAEYHLASKRIWKPDGHPIIYGHPGQEVLLHTETERRKWRENPSDTEEKLEKAYEYMKSRDWESDAQMAIVCFLATTAGRKNALMSYTREKFGPTKFFAFAETKDWVSEAPLPDPSKPLVPIWDRVGHEPIDLFNMFQPVTKGGSA